MKKERKDNVENVGVDSEDKKTEEKFTLIWMKMIWKMIRSL